MTRFYLHFQYGASGYDQGGHQPHMHAGWLKHVSSDYVQNQLKWAGPDAGVMTHNAFGFWRGEGMEIDSYEHAQAAGCDWLTHDFAKAWAPVCKERTVKGYVGNGSWHARLTALQPLEYAKLVRRNLKPYKDAGFAGIVLDAAGEAISHPYTLQRAEWPGDTRVRRQSLDALTLAVIDGMGFQQTGIEPTPRRFAPWVELSKRDVWIKEGLFQTRHGSDAQADNGFGRDLKFITGRIHRIMQLGDFPGATQDERAAKLVERAREAVQAGHVPVVPGWALLGKFTPEDFLGASSPVSPETQSQPKQETPQR